MVLQLPFPCIVWATILTSIVFVSTFIIDFLLLTYWIRPRIVFCKQMVAEEKIKALEEELKHEVVQRVIEEWRKPIRRRALIQALISAITVFAGVYLLCRFMMCPTSLP